MPHPLKINSIPSKRRYSYCNQDPLTTKVDQKSLFRRLSLQKEKLRKERKTLRRRKYPVPKRIQRAISSTNSTLTSAVETNQRKLPQRPSR
jgi:hypothetical protein